MSRIECTKVRQEIDELGKHDGLSTASRNHVRECDECASLDNNDRKLRSMIASLSAVEAPADFDFKLRARLAAASPANGNVSLHNFFGVRSIAAFATLVLLFGIVLVLVNNRGRNDSVAVSNAPTQQANAVASNNPPVEMNAPPSKPDGEVATLNSTAPESTSANVSRRIKGTAASQFVARRVKTTDLSATSARLLRPGSAPGSAVFPLGASYQSLKVSVDDGRGTSRTISLPRVSFGSSRALAQNPTPTMASLRDSW